MPSQQADHRSRIFAKLMENLDIFSIHSMFTGGKVTPANATDVMGLWIESLSLDAHLSTVRNAKDSLIEMYRVVRNRP